MKRRLLQGGKAIVMTLFKDRQPPARKPKRRPTAGQIGGVCGVSLGAGALWFLLAQLPPMLVPADVAEDNRQTLLRSHRETILAGLQTAIGGGALGLGYLFWRDRRQSLSQQDRDRLVNAIELLFDPQLGARIGALYALEAIAQASPADHPLVMEVLTTFIREQTLPPATPPTDKPTADVQAALTIIGRRRIDYDVAPIDLRHCQLTGAMLTRANLADAALTGTRLDHAQLQGANLQGAQLEGANLCRATMHQANLEAANLDRANLQWAQLGAANLTAAHLDEVILQQAQLQGTILRRAQLTRSNLQGALLPHAKLEGATLSHTNLHQAELRGAKLQGATLTHTTLQQVRLDEADLHAATLDHVNLRWASLRGANLQQVTCHQADLQGACLTAALLDRGILAGANLQDAQLDIELTATEPTESASATSRPMILAP